VKPVRIAIDPLLSSELHEVKYVFRTLLRMAGFPWEFRWSSDSLEGEIDIYYGRPDPAVSARIRINACGKAFSEMDSIEPELMRESHGLTFLEFSRGMPQPLERSGNSLSLANDIVFTSFWLLVGGPEPRYKRDRSDNLNLSGSFFLRHSLQTTPLVSMYAAFLRGVLREWGREPLHFPAAGSFSLTHDVDYPQMIRWIECLRLIKARGWKAWPSVTGVVRGTNHFWTFAEWVDWQKQLGTRPAFYFMARKGSLLQYALGTPDDFYDVEAPEFRDLFRYLRDEGCEIGLHASYHAWRSAGTLRREKEKIEGASGVPVEGNRHHYWHLDPRAPHETLALHEKAGLLYDSSLGLEYYPGFRRGICHPFQPYHPGLRREIDVVQLPPAWMDDHFDRRLVQNRIAEPVDYARSLVQTAVDTGGVVVVDYHSRGMNSDFYPRYGPWIQRFIETQPGGVVHRTAGEIVREYKSYERTLQSYSCDAITEQQPGTVSSLEIRRMTVEDLRPIALLHHSLFGDRRIHGYSIATFGVDFLERTFYKLNLENPYFYCDVARYRGKIAGFSVYSTRKAEVFRHMLRHNIPGLTRGCLRLLVRQPASIPGLLQNLRYAGGERSSWTEEVEGWWLVAGVDPDFRTRDFEARTGVHVASRLFDNMEQTMLEERCGAWYGVVRPDNPAIKVFLERRGANLLGTSEAQGLQMEYYLKTLGYAGKATAPGMAASA
jgi:hypothetical protein